MSDSGDFILIRSPDGAEEQVAVKSRDVLTIGRKSGNDLVLDDPYVGRYHARVQFDGTQYWVRDLGSTNRAELNGFPLVPDERREWTPGDELRIGNYLLYIVREPFVESPPPQPGRIALSIEETELSVAPGGSTSTPITICNLGPVYDTFDMTVEGEGVRDEWVTLEPVDAIRLEPDEEGTVTLRISPPRDPKSRAGLYPLKIRARSRTKPDEVAEVPAVLTIMPYYESRPELSTRRIVGKRGIVWVRIEDNGNAQQPYSIALEDPKSDLAFEPAETKLTVPAGEEAEAEFRVMLRRRRWIGDEKPHPFSVEISAPGENILPHPGSIRSTGYLSAGALRLLGSALVMVLVLSFLWFNVKPPDCWVRQEGEVSPDPPFQVVVDQPVTIGCNIGIWQRAKLVRPDGTMVTLDQSEPQYDVDEGFSDNVSLSITGEYWFIKKKGPMPILVVTPTPTPTPTDTPPVPTSTLIPTATPTPTSTPEPTPGANAGVLTLSTWSYSRPGYAFASLWLSGQRAEESWRLLGTSGKRASLMTSPIICSAHLSRYSPKAAA